MSYMETPQLNHPYRESEAVLSTTLTRRSSPQGSALFGLRLLSFIRVTLFHGTAVPSVSGHRVVAVGAHGRREA